MMGRAECQAACPFLLRAALLSFKMEALHAKITEVNIPTWEVAVNLYLCLLLLVGQIYNTYLCAKYGVKIKGVEQSDIELAQQLVELDRNENKLVELPLLVESEVLEARVEGKYRTVDVKVRVPPFLDAGAWLPMGQLCATHVDERAGGRRGGSGCGSG